MAKYLVLYSLVHQPRRVRLPARPIPPGAGPQEMENLLFDPEMDKHYLDVIGRWCYHPACEAWQWMLDQGMKLGIGLSQSIIRQLDLWDPPLFEKFKRLATHENAELVGVEPYHGVTLLFDLLYFIELMDGMRKKMKERFGKAPVVTDTTEMMMSSDIFAAIGKAGFKAAFMDGRPWVLQWRSPTRLYRDSGSARILVRHFDLSDDVGYRFSNRNWDGWPLMADSYAKWIAEAEGDFVVLAWDFETFGHHHDHGTGIFQFLRALPAELHKRGVECLLPSEAVEIFHDKSHRLPLPPFPATWAGVHGSMEFFLGNQLQQAVFRLMIAALNKARLTGDEKLIEIALWLTQSDNLHWLQWVGHRGAEADVSAYFTPVSWRGMGVDRMVWEHQCVYKNFINALDGP